MRIAPRVLALSLAAAANLVLGALPARAEPYPAAAISTGIIAAIMLGETISPVKSAYVPDTYYGERLIIAPRGPIQFATSYTAMEECRRATVYVPAFRRRMEVCY